MKETIIKFAQAELNHNLIQRDGQREFNWDSWKKCGELGIQGLPIPTEYGGRNTDSLTTIYALEGLGYGCKDSGLNFSINAHLWGCAMPILSAGTQGQKQAYLPRASRQK